METFHYTMVDPQMAPIDVALPEDIYRLTYPSHGEELDEKEEKEEEQTGIIGTVSRIISSPIDLLVYLIDIWVEGTVKKSLYEKFA